MLREGTVVCLESRLGRYNYHYLSILSVLKMFVNSWNIFFTHFLSFLGEKCKVGGETCGIQLTNPKLTDFGHCCDGNECSLSKSSSKGPGTCLKGLQHNLICFTCNHSV